MNWYESIANHWLFTLVLIAAVGITVEGWIAAWRKK